MANALVRWQRRQPQLARRTTGGPCIAGENTGGFAGTATESKLQPRRHNNLRQPDANRLKQLTAINQFGVQASALPASVEGCQLGQEVQNTREGCKLLLWSITTSGVALAPAFLAHLSLPETNFAGQRSTAPVYARPDHWLQPRLSRPAFSAFSERVSFVLAPGASPTIVAHSQHARMLNL